MAATTNGTTDPAPAAEGVIRLEPLARATYEVPIVGLSPVIPHKWSEKSKRMMRDKQSGSRVQKKHDPKDPVEEAEAATYYLPDGRVGLMAVAFKAAMVGGVRYFEGLTMTAAKQLFWIEGEGPDQLVALDFDERELREDTPRNSGGTADLRYRYAYWPWRAVLPVSFVTSVIDLGSIITLVNAAGMGGVGDWRPSAPKSATGTFGRFEVAAEADIAQVA